MTQLRKQIDEAVAAIRTHSSLTPEVAIVLGTGLGAFSQTIEAEATIPFTDIPHFPRTTLAAHAGNLVLGTVAGRNVVAMDGRFHYYEGYSMQEVTIGVRVMRALGAKLLILSNACGGINPKHQKGDILLIEDHINLMGDNPLIGVNDESLGPRFPDMSEPYDRKLIALAQERALALKIPVQLGVYVGVTGPCLETRAEYRFLRAIGADLVGMSTVPEVIVAAQVGLRVLGMSIATDLCLPDALEKADINKIIAAANAAEPHLTRLVKDIVKQL